MGEPTKAPPAQGGGSVESPAASAPSGAAQAGSPAAQGSSDGDHASEIVALKRELEAYRQFDPLLSNLVDYPDLVQAIADGTYSPPAATGGAAKPGTPGAGAGGSDQDARYSTIEQRLARQEQQFADLMLEVGLSQGQQKYGDEWERDAILRQVARTGVTDPEEAFHALRSRKLSKDALNKMVEERVKTELARRAAASTPSPAGVASPAGAGSPEASPETPGLVGPSLSRAIRETAASSGMAPVPKGLIKT